MKYRLMDHQKSTWKLGANEFNGIVKFATGAGKTFVGIDAINLYCKSHLQKKLHML